MRLEFINVDFPVTQLLIIAQHNTMSSLVNLTVLQLQRALQIKQQIESLERELQQIEGTQRNGLHRGRRTISAAGRQRIADAQRARWAKQKGSNSAPKAKRKSSMSAAGRARIAAAQRRRWARVKAGQS
jgi:hypothetical protein